MSDGPRAKSKSAKAIRSREMHVTGQSCQSGVKAALSRSHLVPVPLPEGVGGIDDVKCSCTGDWIRSLLLAKSRATTGSIGLVQHVSMLPAKFRATIWAIQLSAAIKSGLGP